MLKDLFSMHNYVDVYSSHVLKLLVFLKPLSFFFSNSYSGYTTNVEPFSAFFFRNIWDFLKTNNENDEEKEVEEEDEPISVRFPNVVVKK